MRVKELPLASAAGCAREPRRYSTATVCAPRGDPMLSARAGVAAAGCKAQRVECRPVAVRARRCRRDCLLR